MNTELKVGNLSVMEPARIIVLASRSPRRRELLESIVGVSQLRVLPPSSDAESGFSDISDFAGIETRLTEIVRRKRDDVLHQLSCESIQSTAESFVVAADTIVIVAGDDGRRIILGQPSGDDWKSEVREWFHRWLSGRRHEVWTGVCVSHGTEVLEFIVRSIVRFITVDEELLEWYLSTGESPGKAGGYAIQGHAAVFVDELRGSLTNVIGLPVIEVTEALREAGWRRAGES